MFLFQCLSLECVFISVCDYSICRIHSGHVRQCTGHSLLGMGESDLLPISSCRLLLSDLLPISSCRLPLSLTEDNDDKMSRRKQLVYLMVICDPTDKNRSNFGKVHC